MDKHLILIPKKIRSPTTHVKLPRHVPVEWIGDFPIRTPQQIRHLTCRFGIFSYAQSSAWCCCWLSGYGSTFQVFCLIFSICSCTSHLPVRKMHVWGALCLYLCAAIFLMEARKSPNCFCRSNYQVAYFFLPFYGRHLNIVALIVDITG